MKKIPARAPSSSLGETFRLYVSTKPCASAYASASAADGSSSSARVGSAAMCRRIQAMAAAATDEVSRPPTSRQRMTTHASGTHVRSSPVAMTPPAARSSPRGTMQ